MRLFQKRKALIPEAQGAYFGSTRRLSRKHEALIPEAQGAYLIIFRQFPFSEGTI